MLSSALDTLAHRAASYRIAGHRVSRPALAGIALAGALLLVVPRRVWRIARLGVTAVHETGHAVVALVVGRKVTAIHLRADSSGETLHYGPAGGFRRLLTALAGYPAPGVLAVGGAALLADRQPRVWLVVLVALGVVNVVLWVRNAFGLFVMALWIAGLGWLFVRGTARVEAGAGAVAVWFFALGGLRASFEVPRAPAASDAADAGKVLHLPAGVCKAGFVLAAAAATAAAARLLSITLH